MVVREYLVENFGFDDSQLKTMVWGSKRDRPAMQTGFDTDLDLPHGTEVPADKNASATRSPVADAAQPAQGPQ